ncbi:hypothetical protein NE865_08356 [Phthorimaea operculella]|nr:hypothetical protein NE865_08356 [Phthorimaea operculella]
MAPIDDIKATQLEIEANIMKRMTELEGQIQNATGSKGCTVAKVAEELRVFRDLTWKILGLLRSQIAECARSVDDMETRKRRKVLIFNGIPESSDEQCQDKIIGIIKKIIKPEDVPDSFQACHRIGQSAEGSVRPILVRFNNLAVKSKVWNGKAKLKGTKVAVKEFLTKSRQSVFMKARQHFGMTNTWTQDGIINIKASDGKRHKLSTAEEFDALVKKYPAKQAI